jgi:hypothetical protein
MQQQRVLARDAVGIFHHTFNSRESPEQIMRSLPANHALDTYGPSFKSFHFVPASATDLFQYSDLAGLARPPEPSVVDTTTVWSGRGSRRCYAI